MKIEGCLKGTLRVLQGNLEDVKRLFEKSFKTVLWKGPVSGFVGGILFPTIEGRI